MDKQTFKYIFTPLATGALLVALYSGWQAIAPFAIKGNLANAQDRLATTCKGTAGCRRIILAAHWSAEQNRYQTAASIGISKATSDAGKQYLVDSVRAQVGNAAASSLFYRGNLSTITVSFRHD